jgi:hypothetical protein
MEGSSFIGALLHAYHLHPLVEIFKYMTEFMTSIPIIKEKMTNSLKIIIDKLFRIWCGTMMWQISSISHKGHMLSH